MYLDYFVICALIIDSLLSSLSYTKALCPYHEIDAAGVITYPANIMDAKVCEDVSSSITL